MSTDTDISEYTGRRSLREHIRTTAAYWFECGYCDKTWRKQDLNALRRTAARHLNEEHGDTLQRTHDRVTTEEHGGHHVHDNDYVVTRIPIYVTPFDILQPMGQPWEYIGPSDHDSVCQDCGRRIPRTLPDAARVEKHPDDVLDDTWRCRVCVDDEQIAERREQNTQLDEWVDK